MTLKPLKIGSIVLLVFLAPASAYHIQGNYVPDPATPSMFTSGDWILDSSQFVACESDGPFDPRNPQIHALPGIGGLCMAGRNAVTGEDAPTSAPVSGDWTRLDICSATTVGRENDPLLGFQQNDCSGGFGLSGGRTDTIGWFAEVGAFTCFVPTQGTLLDLALGARADRDYALYYEEQYAWWSSVPGGVGPGFHGHVEARLDSAERRFDANDATNQILRGSVEATAFSSTGMAAVQVIASNIASTGPYPSNCGPNPVTPVLAAPNLDNNDPPPAVPFLGPPATVVLTDDGGGGADVFLRVNPGWACTPVIQSGADHYVECISSGPFENVCVTVTVVAHLATGTVECAGGGGVSATAAPVPSVGSGAQVATDSSMGAVSPFRCTAHLGSPSLPGWTVTCKVNDP